LRIASRKLDAAAAGDRTWLRTDSTAGAVRSQSAIRNPQSAIRNPQSLPPKRTCHFPRAAPILPTPMKRRTFVKSSVAACLGGSFALEKAAAAPNAAAGAREYYELRTYKLKPGKQEFLDAYLSAAFIPALGRFGIGPVGVFTESVNGQIAVYYVLIVYKSAEDAATLAGRLAADPQHQKDAADYLAVSPADAVYDRVESSLLGAIAGIPKLEKPDASKPRELNLRIYESHNERAAAKKIELFNEHELGIFRKVGLTPVFFGQTLIGSKMPNLTYMLVFPDNAEHDAAWKRFGGDQDWKKFSGMPEYSDKEIVSRITNKILAPAPYSQI
jgi:NIPSNAP